MLGQRRGGGDAMKVTLDLTRLLEQGKISQAEFDKLGALSAQDTGSLAFNILIGFGVAAVSVGAVALVPAPLTAALVGAAVFAFGLVLVLARSEHWALLAQICLCVGALIFGGGILAIDEGSLRAFFLVTAVFTVAAIAARSGLLMVAAVLALASCIGARTGYWHATYALSIAEPTLTVVLFSLLALATYHLSKRLKSDYERLALMAARTSVFLVNFGFWIGSLWGDRLVLMRSFQDIFAAPDPAAAPIVLPPWLFSAGWALALIGTGIWATRAGRRWAVNVVAVFGAIHFYTQWFDNLGPTPVSFLLGGLLLLAFALGLWTFNRRSEAVPK
jgi:iron complex transport system permease protein